MSRSMISQPKPRFAFNKLHVLLIAGFIVVTILCLAPTAVAEKSFAIPAPSAQVFVGLTPAMEKNETAVLAGGCFWGIQAVFQHTKGVLNAVSGYAGGQPSDADYERVSGGGTGHAEAVQISFDPQQISYAQLLQIYFSVAHDPTQLNRQYPDVGTQYRSAIFYQDANQKMIAQRYMAQLDKANIFPGKIVTQLTEFKGFYPAEKYHQNYATLHPDSSYIARFDLPKIVSLKTLMPSLYREQAALVAQ